MSFAGEGGCGTKFGFRTKLVMPTPGPDMGLNDIDGTTFGVKQCAAVRTVRELISEPVQPEKPPTPPTKRLTVFGNWLVLSK